MGCIKRSVAAVEASRVVRLRYSESSMRLSPADNETCIIMLHPNTVKGIAKTYSIVYPFLT